MDSTVLNFAGVMLVIIASIGGLSFVWTWTRRELRRQKQSEPLKQRDNDDRLIHLQQSVDAIAVEVERIAEGQRFSTKLLSDSNRNGVIQGGR
jgi:hypothetical protein